jgi:hypothetical protein
VGESFLAFFPLLSRYLFVKNFAGCLIPFGKIIDQNPIFFCEIGN